MRGEYRLIAEMTLPSWELPPRARRIPGPALIAGAYGGTTSACAENTPNKHPCDHKHRNYLRVRGEYTAKRWIVSAPAELPPRARRIPPSCSSPFASGRTTSACAENTAAYHDSVGTDRNYLRVRGEYHKSWYQHCSIVELPPRARRILDFGGFVFQTE